MVRVAFLVVALAVVAFVGVEIVAVASGMVVGRNVLLRFQLSSMILVLEQYFGIASLKSAQHGF